MQIIGTNFSEVSVKRNKFDKEVKIGNVKNNVKVDSVESAPIAIESLGDAVVFNYTFTSEYNLEEPKDKMLGEITIKGDVVAIDDKKKIKTILGTWEKDKKLEPEVMNLIMNVALSNAQIEAITMSKKVMLPTPLPLPTLTNQTSGAAQ